jgi:hypothetical protein
LLGIAELAEAFPIFLPLSEVAQLFKNLLLSAEVATGAIQHMLWRIVVGWIRRMMDCRIDQQGYPGFLNFLGIRNLPGVAE